MEKEYKISWLKVIGILILIIIIIAILCLVYPKKVSEGHTTSSTYLNNITMMKEAGFEYFKGSNLPNKIGESSKISLQDMVRSNLIVEFFDENGNACNEEDSYIQATKTLDDEYSLKVFLSCKEKTDYIVTTISNQECNNCDTKEDEKENVKEESTKNETNNGSSSNDRKPAINNVTNVTNVTKYNISYVNSCNKCTGNECPSNCVSSVYYTVTYDSNGGSSVSSLRIKSGDVAPNKTTTRSGYTFLGWYLDGKLYNFETPVTKKITLVAKWKKDSTTNNKETYIVKFNSNGGTSIPSQKVEEGSVASRPNNPTKSCYTFVGWYTNSSLTKKYDFSNPVYADITLYAKWVENDSCKHIVDFDSNGGTNIDSQKVRDGELATKPSNPTKACSDFSGWYTNSSLTKKYDFNSPVYNDMTLYANWTDNGSCVETHRVKFNSNGGTYVATQTVEDGNRAKEPNEPTKNGYTFLGWYLDGEEFSFRTRIYEDITLYAKWEKDEVKYNTYCKIKEERIYSTAYVGKSNIENKTTYNYTYQLKYVNRYAQNMKVVDYGNISNSEYTKAYNYWKAYNKPISLVNGSGNAIDAGSGTNLKTYSLKSSNFSTSVTYNYKSGSNWYFTVYDRLYNLNSISASPYYTSSSYYVYFVPIYFDIEYTDLDDCVNDKASYAYKYDNYEIVDTYYR